MNNKILIIGAYYSTNNNNVEDIMKEFYNTNSYVVEQKWLSLGDSKVSDLVSNNTVLTSLTKDGKSIHMNKLLQNVNISDYKYILVSDDDFEMENGFLDKYLFMMDKYNFSLSQPSRIDHQSWQITWQIPTLNARRTMRIEGGPLIAIRYDLAPLILPFNEQSPMGWGEHVIWPHVVQKHNLKMGIIDAVGVNHTMRPVASLYDGNKAMNDMFHMLKQVDYYKGDGDIILERHIK